MFMDYEYTYGARLIEDGFFDRIEGSSWCGDDAGTVGWQSFSRGFHFNRQSETCISDLILECKPHKLSFALVERFRKPSGPLWTDRSTALLNVTKVRPGYSKKFCKLRKTSLVGFAQA
jgi:hypothetical protein